MRGCLFVLVLGTALVAGVAWFGSAPIADAVIRAMLDGAGYRSAATTVTVSADPPPRLLLGRADSITIDGTDVDWRTLHAASIRVTLEGVDLFSRTAASVDGTIERADVADELGGTPAIGSIAIHGPGTAAGAIVTVDAATVRSVVASAVQRDFNVATTDVQLVAPATLRLITPGATIEGTVAIENSALVFANRPGSVTMLRIDPSIPLVLRSVAVVDGGLRIDGTLDANALLRP